MIAERVAVFALKRVSTVPQNAPVKAQTIGHSRFSRASVAHRPVPRMKLVDPAPGVAADVGRIIPSAVVHDAPADKLRARIVRVAVVVEEIGHREAAHRHGVAQYGTLSG